MRVACLIPAHNEAAILEANAGRVSEWGRAAFGPDFMLVLSENGSTDSTAWLARVLEKTLPNCIALSARQPGKGGAIKRAAASVEADVYLMLDADLSADLDSAAALVRAVAAGADIAVGSRRLPGARVTRPLLRRLLTWMYALTAEAALRTGVRDLQCGCKAFSRRVRDTFLPRVRDEGLFFDTELIARLRSAGAEITELPVTWNERGRGAGQSKVRPLQTGWTFLRNVLTLRKELR